SLAGRYYLRQVRAPAHGEGGVGNVFLYRADGDRAEVVIQGTGPFAETVLRADAAADLRQGIGLVRQFRCLEDIAFGNQLQPVGDEVVHRALPFTIRVATLQAAVRLLGCFQRSEEHTSELQSRENIVCRLRLEKKKSALARTSGTKRSIRTTRRPAREDGSINPIRYRESRMSNADVRRLSRR